MNSKERIRELRYDLDMESSKVSPDFQIMAGLRIDLEKVSLEEEKYWQQKSNENWLLYGDKNTQFSMVVYKPGG